MPLFPASLLITLPWLNPLTFGPSPTWVSGLLALCVGAVLIPMRTFVHWPQATASAWLLAGSLSSAMAVVQYLDWSDAFSPAISITSVGEAFANLRQRNLFATLTSIALVALLWWSRRLQVERLRVPRRNGGTTHAGSRRLQVERLRVHSLAFVGMSALAVGNAASSSRTGLFQIVLVCAFTALWRGWRVLRRLLVVYVLTYAAALVVLPNTGIRSFFDAFPLSEIFAVRLR